MKPLALRASFVASLATLLAALAAPAGAAIDPAPLVAPVDAFAAAYDALGPYPEASFTADCAVVDAFAPYAWNGPGAPRRWYAGLVGATPAARRAIAATHPHIVFGRPQFARVTGLRAYLVVPGTLTFDAAGARRTQRGRWTLVEVRGPNGWRIASQTWAIADGFADA